MNNNFGIELSDELAQNVAGGGVYIDVYKKDNSYVYSQFGVLAAGLVYGNLADAEAKAKAYGYDTFTQTLSYTQTTPYSSDSYSGSKSVTN